MNLEKSANHYRYSIAGLCLHGDHGPAIRPSFVTEHREEAHDIAQRTADFYGFPCTLVYGEGGEKAFRPQEGAPRIAPSFPQELPLHVRQHILLLSDLSPEVLAQSHPDVKGLHPHVAAHPAHAKHPLVAVSPHHFCHVDRGHHAAKASKATK